MGDYTKINLREDIEDIGLQTDVEFRSGRAALGTQHSSVSYTRWAPNFRVPFGHRHRLQEEVYIVVSGGGRMKLGNQILELEQWDAVRVPADTMRQFEAGPDGAELLMVGAPRTEPNDGERTEGWWSD